MVTAAQQMLLDDLGYLWKEGVITDAEKRRITMRIHKLPEKWAKQNKH